MSDAIDVRRERARKALEAIARYLDARNSPTTLRPIEGKRFEAAIDAVVALTSITG